MQIIKNIKQMQVLSRKLRTQAKTIGFVPTMGALHEGHLSLVRRSKKENTATIISIFVNPAQFGPKEDFEKYPRDLKGDFKKLSGLKVDAVFIPDSKEMYPEGTCLLASSPCEAGQRSGTAVRFSASINVGHIGEILCGASRPGHFNGVATVVAKLFNIVIPDRAYFGQKDFQQTVIIKKLVTDLNFDIDIVVCPTVREADGLAMSSRNSYLNNKQRKSSAILYGALKYGEGLIRKGMDNREAVRKEMQTLIKSEPLAKIEYIEIIRPETLEKMKKIKPPAVICIAVKIGPTRLIDNVII
ncbi:MAG: pantoate--beta-alanine ligase [Nitrospirota bacterium]